ncbi:hypothetical protein HKD37_15G042953 [Glycine soja]
MVNSSKRTKFFVSGGYSSSSSPGTPIEEHERHLEYEIVIEDTFDMSEKQLQDHAKYCDYISCVDTLLDQMIDEELEDNTKEEVTRLILETHKQVEVTCRHKLRRKVVRQNHEELHDQLFNDYFSENLAPNNHNEYFQIRINVTCRKGISLLQKCTTVLHILAYGSLADDVDAYIRIVETTIVECLHRFYLRRPNNEDIERLLQRGVTRGFPRHVSAMQYIVNEIQYDMGYYLVDKIYPDFTTFVKTISMSQGEKGKLFAQRQESTRNDVKHACHLEFSNPDLQLYWFNTFMRCS